MSPSGHSVLLCHPGLQCPSCICLCSVSLNVPLIFSLIFPSLAPSVFSHLPGPQLILPQDKQAKDCSHLQLLAGFSPPFSHFAHGSAVHTRTHPQQVEDGHVFFTPALCSLPASPPIPLSLASAEHHALLWTSDQETACTQGKRGSRLLS